MNGLSPPPQTVSQAQPKKFLSLSTVSNNEAKAPKYLASTTHRLEITSVFSKLSHLVAGQTEN